VKKKKNHCRGVVFIQSPAGLSPKEEASGYMQQIKVKYGALRLEEV